MNLHDWVERNFLFALAILMMLAGLLAGAVNKFLFQSDLVLWRFSALSILFSLVLVCMELVRKAFRKGARYRKKHV